MSGKAAYYDTGFGLVARGDKTKSYTYDDATGNAMGTYLDFLSVRPQKTMNVDGNYFKAGWGGNHELKFGFSYRDVVTNSSTRNNGNGLVGFSYNGPGTAGGANKARIYRDGNVEYGGKYASFYLGDVFTKDRLTVNVGARFDKQTAKNLASEAPANASIPNLLPALKFGQQGRQHHLERHLASRWPQLCAERVAENGCPPLAGPLRRPALLRQRHQPESGGCELPGLRLERRQW